MNSSKKIKSGSVLEFYKEKILKEQIENYWKQINRVQYENPQISCKNSDIFSSVDIGAWEKEFNEAFPELYRQNFPQNFTKRMNGLLHDLKILLPNNRAVKAILPVLLVSYFQNKRCGDLFADILNDEDLRPSHSCEPGRLRRDGSPAGRLYCPDSLLL